MGFWTDIGNTETQRTLNPKAWAAHQPRPKGWLAAQQAARAI